MLKIKQNMNLIDVKLDENVKIGQFNIIKGNVKIGKNVKIGNGCTIEGNIEIGDYCEIGNNVTIVNNVKIGKNNKIYSGCCIGYPAQHLNEHSIEDKCIEIGENNIFRENCTVHLPYSNKKTIIKNNCFFMVNTHISHDTIIYNNVITANNVAIGGHCEIYEYANIGLNVSIHQFCKIGHYCMVGMGSSIIKDVLPFYMVTGFRNVKLSLNLIGFRRKYRGNLTIQDIKNYKKYVDVNKSLPQDLGNELDKILEPFKNSNNGFYC